MPGRDHQDNDPDRRHPRDSTEVVAPFARVRVVVALVCILIGLGVLAWRMMS
ncbi:hypothetical protein roselon_01151 [Roseibacterium elongatum DSM 19469]|uniref:Uncharacterized protein n=1 Tax=Roseicyclus elongatus DSM 19469 TaxID=1294273 RepID=W8S091_9RHOB|nr:hypothetical protein [Roseibacterium elongatum]AHM03542.1 hypothetical protein roselon_01151 [Roseibacterium elongatum DSM 19469]